MFAGVGLANRRTADAQPAAPPGRAAPLCTKYPQVPGLCHMSESAGRMWVARYERDNRTIDRELERQENRARERPLTMADAITHQHFESPAPVG
jgi:hypothetical protein